MNKKFLFKFLGKISLPCSINNETQTKRKSFLASNQDEVVGRSIVGVLFVAIDRSDNFFNGKVEKEKVSAQRRTFYPPMMN